MYSRKKETNSEQTEFYFCFTWITDFFCFSNNCFVTVTFLTPKPQRQKKPCFTNSLFQLYCKAAFAMKMQGFGWVINLAGQQITAQNCRSERFGSGFLGASFSTYHLQHNKLYQPQNGLPMHLLFYLVEQRILDKLQVMFNYPF